MTHKRIGGERVTESPSGLLVVQYELTKSQKKQRREDNKAARAMRKKTRNRKKHGRQ